MAVGGSGSRIAPLSAGQWDDRARRALAQAGMGDVPDGSVPNAVGTLLHHPRLAGSFLRFNMTLLVKPALPPRWREVLVLRVAWRTGCAYEWVQHVVYAGVNGVIPAEVDAIARAETEALEPVERLLVAAADQLLDGYRIDDATWTGLAEHLGAEQLIEVPFVVGTYATLAMALNSFGTGPDDDALQQFDGALPPPAAGGVEEK